VVAEIDDGAVRLRVRWVPAAASVAIDVLASAP
jgi:hypothetical protein